jgi:putative transposase
LEASDAIELSGLCDTERSRAIIRFEIIRPSLEDGVPLTRVGKEQRIVLRTARRWVERYRKNGLAGLVRNERNDKDERRLFPELQEIIEGLASSRPKRSRTC